MSDLTIGQESADRVARSSTDLYRAVWRWHFYAGLLVLPFIITLAVTGALYLFRDELDAFIHSDLKRVEFVDTSARATPSEMVNAALAAYSGKAVKYTDPSTPALSAEITVVTEQGERIAIYVNPYSREVLGSLPDRGTIMWTIRYLHSLKSFGPYARALIEIAGGWAILLVGTGVYLWWPRKQNGGVLSLRGTPRKRVFWRDTHAVLGITVGFFIAFLAFTGMPWSGVWGKQVNQWANGNNFGYPAGVRIALPMSDEHLNHVAKTSWTLEQAKIPESAGQSVHAESIGLDNAVMIFERLGLHRGFAVNLPANASGVFSGSVYPDDIARQRVVHLDQYSGKPLVDVSYAQYGPLGRWLEYGINIHLGQQFGLTNQLVLLVACIGMVMLSISAGVMWWKRRPKGSLGVPPMPADKRVFRGLFAILIVGGVLFPLVGLSLLIMLGLDWGYQFFRKQVA